MENMLRKVTAYIISASRSSGDCSFVFVLKSFRTHYSWTIPGTVARRNLPVLYLVKRPAAQTQAEDHQSIEHSYWHAPFGFVLITCHRREDLD